MKNLCAFVSLCEKFINLTQRHKDTEIKNMKNLCAFVSLCEKKPPEE